jgi:serine protease Do
MNNLIEQLNSEMSGAVENARRGLVEIRNGHGAGAGTLWHPDGLIITNAHVVHGRHSLKAILPDGRTLPAQVVAIDPQRDLAALKVDATDLPTVDLGDSRMLKAGEWVTAIGHPWGVTGAVTSGVVIGEGSQFPEMPKQGEWGVVSLHMRPGHSGGPLVNNRGQVVGINTMITGPDVGMAVPVHVVKAFLQQAGLGKVMQQSTARKKSEYV